MVRDDDIAHPEVRLIALSLVIFEISAAACVLYAVQRWASPFVAPWIPVAAMLTALAAPQDCLGLVALVPVPTIPTSDIITAGLSALTALTLTAPVRCPVIAAADRAGLKRRRHAVLLHRFRECHRYVTQRTVTSRGVRFSRFDPASVQTTMSSMRAPYSPSR